jgi:amino-acid N-acetyltransferase
LSETLLTLRPARAQDQPVIRAMVRQARLDPTNLHWQNFIVAESDNAIIGVCQIKPYPGARELGSLVVRKDWRRKGVGGRLIRALLEREEADRGPLFLLCREQLASYYARFGFARIGWREARGAVRAKYLAGRALGGLIGRRIVVMRWRQPAA